jgi:hypothetical protein
MGALCYRAAQPNKTIQLYYNITLDFQKPWIFKIRLVENFV